MDVKSLKKKQEPDLEKSGDLIASFSKTLPTYPIGTLRVQNSTRFGVSLDLRVLRQELAEHTTDTSKSAEFQRANFQLGRTRLIRQYLVFGEKHREVFPYNEGFPHCRRFVNHVNPVNTPPLQYSGLPNVSM